MIVAYVKDLIFATKIRSTAQSVGAEVSFVQSAPALTVNLQGMQPSLVIIDLDAGGDALDALAAAQTALPAEHVIAFVSHVHVELIESARLLGAERVMPRSRFSAELPQILKG